MPTSRCHRRTNLEGMSAQFASGLGWCYFMPTAAPSNPGHTSWHRSPGRSFAATQIAVESRALIVMHTQPLRCEDPQLPPAALVGPLLRARVVMAALLLSGVRRHSSGTTNWRCGRGPARRVLGGISWHLAALSGRPRPAVRPAAGTGRCSTTAQRPRPSTAGAPRHYDQRRQQANLLVIPQGANGEPGRRSTSPTLRPRYFGFQLPLGRR